MSMESLRALEQVRQRLNTLANSLGKLRHDLETNDPLPSWPSIQNSATLLSHNLQTLHQTLTQAQPLLHQAHVYPLPAYPGRVQEDLLGQLLRKKLQPQVEDWIDLGERHASQSPHTQVNGSAPVNGDHPPPTSKSLTPAQLIDLWNWAGPEGNRVAREMGGDAFDDVFTLEEHEQGIENVVTGLRRKLWESEDEDEGGDGDGEEAAAAAKEKQDTMDVDVVDIIPEEVKRLQRHNVDPSRPPMSLEHVLRFALTAREPPNAMS